MWPLVSQLFVVKCIIKFNTQNYDYKLNYYHSVNPLAGTPGHAPGSGRGFGMGESPVQNSLLQIHVTIY
jgi:hypothetical protein